MVNFLDKLKTYGVFILGAALIVVSVFLFQTCGSLKAEKERNEYIEKQNAQNLSALGDSITAEFNKKLKAWEFSKDNYVVQKLADLEKYNKDLYNELKKVKGDIIAAIKTGVEGDLGGITASNELVVLDSTKHHYGLSFRSPYKDEGFEQLLVGTSRFYAIPNEESKKWSITPDRIVFDTNLTTIRITYGFKNLDDRYQVFAISPSPKIKLIDLDGGYFIDKQPPPPPEKPKKWGFGPYIGFGINTDYNLANPRFGWSLGVSVHYSIWHWRFGKK